MKYDLILARTEFCRQESTCPFILTFKLEIADVHELNEEKLVATKDDLASELDNDDHFNEFILEDMTDNVIGKILEELSKNKDILAHDISKTAAFKACLHSVGLLEIIKNSIDAFQDRPDAREVKDLAMEIEILIYENKLVINVTDNGAGFKPSHLGEYPSRLTPVDLLTVTKSDKSGDSSCASDTLESKPKKKYMGGAGIGTEWVVKVVQSSPIGCLYRVNVLDSENRVQGAKLSFISCLSDSSFDIRDVGHFETHLGFSLSVTQLELIKAIESFGFDFHTSPQSEIEQVKNIIILAGATLKKEANSISKFIESNDFLSRMKNEHDKHQEQHCVTLSAPNSPVLFTEHKWKDEPTIGASLVAQSIVKAAPAPTISRKMIPPSLCIVEAAPAAQALTLPAKKVQMAPQSHSAENTAHIADSVQDDITIKKIRRTPPSLNF